ncbi:MAG TPA: thioredoxin domain-containing protein, partial [Polyangiales bacterium]|nr:thioredoxin domain-containing protein [Polyangiales bacterium]
MSGRENRLAKETSPYLLQHAHNPVDWYPWGDEAIARARAEDKPIFLSVGYSACHWCHVMERESFENEAIAQRMNELYVNVKVDREERPDIDDIYMKAVQALTGQGGWPMSVWLTPQLEPFFGGTYFPPVRAYGRPSFPDVLEHLANAWRTQRDDVVKQAALLTSAIHEEASFDARAALDASVLDASLARIAERIDPVWGGLGGAPKFPHAGDLRMLLRHHARTGDARALALATLTLDRMADGGVYDQLAGGFHRYSVDREWRVPHFEKMLYDNAQLVPAYLEALLLVSDDARCQRYARVARECCDWAITQMQTPEGGFASTQDADSEGEEGRYFVWTPAQLREVLGEPLAARVAAWFDVTEQGNFEHGKSVLWMPVPRERVAEALGVPLSELRSDVEAARVKLLEARSRRVPPGTDDKVLASWNGLMISALALAHQVLDEPRFREAAERAAGFVLGTLAREDGGLHATARAGRAHLEAGLDDYAFVAQGLCDLYESTFEPRYLRMALSFTERIEQRFADRERGGYFTTSEGVPGLIARLKSVHDGALPAGAAVHALTLRRLAAWTGRDDLRAAADAALDGLGALVAKHPHVFSHQLMALDFQVQQPIEVVIAGARGAAGTES